MLFDGIGRYAILNNTQESNKRNQFIWSSYVYSRYQNMASQNKTNRLRKTKRLTAKVHNCLRQIIEADKTTTIRLFAW